MTLTKKRLERALRAAFDAGWFAHECVDRPKDEATFRKRHVQDAMKEINDDNGSK